MTASLLRTVPLLLAAVGGLVVIDAGFVYDDPSALLENPVVNGTAPVWEAFVRDFWGRPASGGFTSWRPLMPFLWALLWKWWPANPLPFHILSATLHVLAVAISMRFVYRLRPSYAWSAAVGTLFALHHHNASNTFFRADDLDRGAYHRFVHVYLVHRFPEPVQWEELESTSSLSALERFVELPAILEPKDPCPLVRIFMRTAMEYEPLHEHVAQHWAPRYPRCVSWPR